MRDRVGGPGITRDWAKTKQGRGEEIECGESAMPVLVRSRQKTDRNAAPTGPVSLPQHRRARKTVSIDNPLHSCPG